MTPEDPSNIDGLPVQWPDRPLWAVSVDLISGRRIAFGRDVQDRLEPFPRAVRASTAVPGVFAPVRLGNRVLVDGGVHSTTNLDLASQVAARNVICIAPMGYDPADPPPTLRRALRQRVNWQVAKEGRRVLTSGARLLVLRPGAEQLAKYPVNFLEHRGAASVERIAREHTLAQLMSPEGDRMLRQIHTPDTAGSP
jgi:predicted acylesterase/phospholipase RssA